MFNADDPFFGGLGELPRAAMPLASFPGPLSPRTIYLHMTFERAEREGLGTKLQCPPLPPPQTLYSKHIMCSGHKVYGTELKGLDIVRRDWCELAKKAGQ